MIYDVHNGTVFHDDETECGIYKARGVGNQYAVLDPYILIISINVLSKREAIRQVTGLRDLAMQQLEAGCTPGPLGAPLLIQTPGPTPFTEVKDKIENTRDLAISILEALQE